MARAMVNKAQVKMIRSIAHGRLRWDDEQYHEFLADRGGPASTLDLGRAEAANLIDILKDLADGRTVRVWRLDGATLLQQREIGGLVSQAGISQEALGGVVHRATFGKCGSVRECSIYQARSVMTALKAIVARQGIAECRPS
jgi:hypothetical protein